MSDADVTTLLLEVERGSREAHDALMNAVYGELRGIAGSLMRKERRNHTLQPTALVNEAYLRLVRGAPKWENRLTSSERPPAQCAGYWSSTLARSCPRSKEEALNT